MTPIVTYIDIIVAILMGYVIMAALVVAIIVKDIVRHTLKNGISQIQTEPVQDKETKSASKKSRAPESKAIGGGKLSGIWKKKHGALGVLRAFRKRNNLPAQQPIEEGLAMNEQFSIPLSSVTRLLSETKAVPNPVEHEVANTEPVNEERPDINMSDTLPAGAEQEVPNMEPANEERPDINMSDTLPAGAVESTQGWSQEEAESTEPVLEELNETLYKEPQQQKTNTDDLFDLFTDEVVEEGEASKLAKGLNNVNVHDLMREGQDIINELRGANK